MGGADLLTGGVGNDTLNGGVGLDFANYATAPIGVVVDLAAGTAADGLGGADLLVGIDGIIGSQFGDSLTGNAWNNTFISMGGDDLIIGGGGYDTLEVAGTDLPDAFTLRKENGRVRLEPAVGQPSTIEIMGVANVRIDTGGGDDEVMIEDLTSSGVTQVDVDLGAGDDWLDASRGTVNVTARGGAGDDLIEGGAGRDILDGGAGEDLLDYSDAPGGVVVTMCRYATYQDGHGNSDLITGFERVIGTPFNDRIIGDGADNVLRGGAGDDFLFGNYGADTLIGGPGDDVIYGMAGDDLLLGGEGADEIYGGTGVDRILGGGGDDYLDGQDGDDDLFGEDGADVLIGNWGDDRLSGGAGDDDICGWFGNDVIHGGAGDDGLHGQYGVDQMFGDEGDDRLYGGNDNDILYGGPGDDKLSGGAGDDQLRGWAGDDTLLGGTGNDELYGDAGEDTLDGGPGGDHIVGGPGADILLDNSGPNTIDEGIGRGLAEVDEGPVEIDLALTAVTGVTEPVRQDWQGLSRRQTLGAEQMIFDEGDGTIDDLTVTIEEQPARGQVTLDGWIATYTPGETFPGSDSFTFTVTNPGGDSVTRTVDLGLPEADIEFGPGDPARIIDADGTTVGVYLSFGEGRLYLGADGNIRRLALLGTAAWSTLVITTDGLGDAQTSVGGMLVDSAVAGVWASTTDFIGERIVIAGWTGHIHLDDVADPHAIFIGGSADATPVNMYFDEVADLSVTSDTPIGVFVATNVANTDGVADRIRAPWLTTLVVRGNPLNPLTPGNFQNDLELYDASAWGYSLTNAIVAGEIACTWTLAGAASLIQARATAETWTLHAGGSVAVIRATGEQLAGALRAEFFGTIHAVGRLSATVLATGADASDRSIVHVLAGLASDVSIDVPGGIHLFNIGHSIDTDAIADAVRAKWLYQLISQRDVDFNLLLGGADAAGYALRAATIYGDLLSGLWDLAGRLGTLYVVGAARGKPGSPLIVRATGSIDNLIADAFEYVHVLAGITGAGDHATDFAQFGEATIAALTVLGRKDPAAPSMVASHFSAAKFGNVLIVNPDIAGGDLGLWCRKSFTDDELRLMVYRDFLGGEFWTYSTFWATAYPGPADFFTIIQP